MMTANTVTRRTALQAITGSLAAGVLCPSDLAAAGSRVIDEDPLKLGFSLYGMKSLPLDSAIRSCSEIGYSQVEFCLNAGYPTEPAVFTADQRRATVELLKSLNMQVPCLMIQISLTADMTTHARNLEIIKSAAELAHELSYDHPPILETVLGGSPAKWDEQKGGMLSQLKDWAATAEKAAIVIAIKAHVGSAVNSPERLLWLLERVESQAIQVAYDYSHFELQGIDLEESLHVLLPRTKFIHVKDTTGDAAKFQFLLPGQGRTNYLNYFRLLRKHNYSGPICVEVSGQVFSKPDYSAIPAARQCYDVLSKAMADSR
jgi:sugar phosphate isomerase/epimerase